MFRMKNKTLDGFEKDKIIKNAGIYTVLGLALGAMTFFGVCDPAGDFRGPKGNAALVGDEVISRYEFNRAYRNTYDQMQRQYADRFDAGKLKIANTVMRQLVNERIMFLGAQKIGLLTSEDEVMSYLVDANAFQGEDGKFSEEFYNNYLRSQGYSEAAFVDSLKRSISAQKLRQFVTEAAYSSKKSAEIDYRLSETKVNLSYVKIDPKALKADIKKDEINAFISNDANAERIEADYKANQKKYDQKEQVKARHILVSFKGARNATADAAKRSKEDAKKRAESLAKKAQAKKSQFSDLAKKETDEASGKKSGGDLGWFSKETMVKEFSDAAFTMKKGQVSDVVESPFGFHIIYVEDKKAAKKIPIEEAKNEIAEAILKKEKLPEMADNLANSIAKKLSEGKATKLLKENNLEWSETGEQNLNARFFPGIGSAESITPVLAKLKKSGDLSEVVDIRGAKYIFRLKEIKPADMSKLDEEKRKQLSSSNKFAQGYSTYSTFESSLRDELNEKIQMNPEYLAIDDRSEENGN